MFDTFVSVAMGRRASLGDTVVKAHNDDVNNGADSEREATLREVSVVGTSREG